MRVGFFGECSLADGMGELRLVALLGTTTGPVQCATCHWELFWMSRAQC